MEAGDISAQTQASRHQPNDSALQIIKCSYSAKRYHDAKTSSRGCEEHASCDYTVPLEVRRTLSSTFREFQTLAAVNFVWSDLADRCENELIADSLHELRDGGVSAGRRKRA